MTLHHCLYPDWGGTQDVWGRKRKFDEPGHGLGFINSQYTSTPYYKDDGRKWNPTLGDHQFWNYNCKDVMTTLDAGLQMVDEAVGDGIWDFYNEFYIRPFLHSLRMEWFGTKLDEPLRDSARKELNKRAIELQTDINSSVGYHLNVNSPKQMQKLLYHDKGYQVKKNRKTGSVTTDKYTLQYFADKKGDRTLNLVIELRKVRDLLSDIINQELGPDGMMRTHYKIGGTDGTRWSSTESILGSSTNLQNIPREGIARRLFLPD
jgi:DNA polymerase I-like protein with 3'-5' exonuclease and polymerase domains